MSHQPQELQTTLGDIAALATNQLAPVAAASVILWDEQEEAFSVSASTVPQQPAETAAREVRGSGGASRWIVDNRKPCAVAEIGNDPFGANPLLEKCGYQAYAGQPLVVDNRALGVFYTLHHEPYLCSAEEHAELARLARWAAMAVAQAQRAEEARREERLLRVRHRDARRRVAELGAELKKTSALHGLIRICLSCKNVRDTEGKWERIEDYLSQRSLAEFSHGLCSDCSREIYLEPLTDPDLQQP